MKKIIILVIFISIFALPSLAFAQNKVEVWEFGSYSCPFCQDLKAYLNNKVKDNPLIEYTYFELVGLDNQANRDKLQALMQAYGATDNGGVPKTFVGDKFIPGDDKAGIDTAIDYCLATPCQQPSAVLARVANINANNAANNNVNNASQKEAIIGWTMLGVFVVVVAYFGYKIIKERK